MHLKFLYVLLCHTSPATEWIEVYAEPICIIAASMPTF